MLSQRPHRRPRVPPDDFDRDTSDRVVIKWVGITLIVLVVGLIVLKALLT